VVAHLVRGVAEHQKDLLGALGDAPQADGEAVAAEDGEDNADGFAAELCANIRGNIINAAIVALRTCHDGLGHGDDIAVAGRNTAFLDGFQDGIGYDFRRRRKRGVRYAVYGQQFFPVL